MGFFDDESGAEEISVEDVQEVASEEMVDAMPNSAEEAGHDPQVIEGEEEPPTSVPLQELIAERRKRQDIEAEIQEQRQNNAVLNERIRGLWENQQLQAQQAQAQQQPPEEVPDPEEDPLGHANWKITKLEQQLRTVATAGARQAQAMQQAQAHQQQQTQSQSIIQQSQNLQTQFAASNPDYWDAYAHLEQTRASELASMGYDESAARQIIDNERGMIVSQALERDAQGNVTGWKQNPAEVAYNLAKMRGYKAAEPAPAPTEVPAQDRMNMMANGQVMASSVGNAGRAAQGGAPTLESIANMSDAEFSKFSAQNPGIIETLLSNG